MSGRSEYLFAIIKYFSFAFFLLFPLQRNFSPLRLRHQTSATKLRYLRSSAFYRAPPVSHREMTICVYRAGPQCCQMAVT